MKIRKKEKKKGQAFFLLWVKEGRRVFESGLSLIINARKNHSMVNLPCFSLFAIFLLLFLFEFTAICSFEASSHLYM